MSSIYKKNPKKQKFSFFRLFLSFASLLLVCVGVFLIWCSKFFPDLSTLNNNVRRPSVIVQSEDGDVLASFGDLHEDIVSPEDLPNHVVNALLAVEDRRFFYHFGIDFIGLVRAVYTNYRAGRVVQGGSTLTQQLAKNILMAQGFFSVRDRSFERKIQEALLAVWLEYCFNKNQILKLYLNRVYFGSGTFGVDAAARRYFDKPAKELSVFESALLSGLLKAPSKYSPAKNTKRSIERATVVLRAMVEAGFLKDYKEELTKGIQNLALREEKQETHTRYFADWVYETLPYVLGSIDKDIIVVTTLDSKIQKYTHESIEKNLEQHAKEYKVSDAAGIVMTPDGAVKAMIGGRDYALNQFNFCTQSKRQPGSAFKPIVVAAFLEKTGATANEMIEDSPIQIGDWSPKNYKYRARGSLSIRDAMALSVNAVTIRLAQRIGAGAVIDMAQRLGITDEMHNDLSMAIGTAEVSMIDMTTVFATFANKGKVVWPYGILEIRDRDGNILYQHKETEDVTFVVSKDVNDTMLDLLRAVIEYGTGKAANISSKIYGKTGSNGHKDAWFFGFYLDEAQDYVLGFWVGDKNNKDMDPRSTGGRLPTWMAKDVFQCIIDDSKKNLLKEEESINKMIQDENN